MQYIQDTGFGEVSSGIGFWDMLMVLAMTPFDRSYMTSVSVP